MLSNVLWYPTIFFIKMFSSENIEEYLLDILKGEYYFPMEYITTINSIWIKFPMYIFLTLIINIFISYSFYRYMENICVIIIILYYDTITAFYSSMEKSTFVNFEKISKSFDDLKIF